MADNVLKILCVKTNKGCFISNADDRYNSENLKVLFFDGKNPADSYCPKWYYLEAYPTSIQRKKIW